MSLSLSERFIPLGAVLTGFGITPYEFSKFTLPWYLAMCFVAYFLLDDYQIIVLFKNISGAFTGPHALTAVMLITYILFHAIYIPVRISKLKQSTDDINNQ